MSQQAENDGKVFDEGYKAYLDGVKEDDCPYDMNAQWGDWADWICGWGAAVEHEHVTKEMHKEARELLSEDEKKFPVDRSL